MRWVLILRLRAVPRNWTATPRSELPQSFLQCHGYSSRVLVVLLLLGNQSVPLPPEDEFDEYVANFLPYFFFGEK